MIKLFKKKTIDEIIIEEQSSRKEKEASKYIPKEIRDKVFMNLPEVDRLVYRILFKTGMRIGEVQRYIDEWSADKQMISMSPQKHNNDRLLPNYLDEFDYDLIKTISVKTDALKKRISKWNGFAGYSPHDFRATWVSIGLAKDVSPHILQRLGGWKKIDSVMKYARINTEHYQWIYEYISSDEDQWTITDDVAQLKKQLSKAFQLIEKLKLMNKNLTKKLEAK